MEKKKDAIRDGKEAKDRATTPGKDAGFSPQTDASSCMLLQHVRARHSRGTVKYDAVVKQYHKQVYLSRHRDAKSAAKASADFLEVSMGKIRQAKADRIAPDQNLERMKLLLQMFEDFVPSDVTGAIEFRLQGAALQVQGPCVYVGALYGKDSRWRFALL